MLLLYRFWSPPDIGSRPIERNWINPRTGPEFPLALGFINDKRRNRFHPQQRRAHLLRQDAFEVDYLRCDRSWNGKRSPSQCHRSTYANLLIYIHVVLPILANN